MGMRFKTRHHFNTWAFSCKLNFSSGQTIGLIHTWVRPQALATILSDGTMLGYLFNCTIFLAFTVGLAAYNGQENTDLLNKKVNASKLFLIRQPPLLKTQNSKADDNVQGSLLDK